MTESNWNAIWGRLNLDSFFFMLPIQSGGSINSMVAAGAGGIVVLGAIITIFLLTWYKGWGPLWREWLTTADHKRIGIMYIVLAFIMLARGVLEGAVMRGQQASVPMGGFLDADHYAELFSTHGTIMIFFVLMPLTAGFMNFVMPLQIGARDVSFPVMNQISLGLTTAGAMLVMLSLVIGHFSTGGWTAYPPYTEIPFQPGTGPDYWIFAVGIAGVGSTLTGLNFAVTIFKERAPGMKLMDMPLFTWTTLCTAIIMVFAMPPLTVAGAMLALDRYLDFHFFTNDLGGNMMNFANLFWLFGHPEVYLLILPSFGIFSEVIATFSGKRLYGYKSLVYATVCIAVLSFTVWVHHFFTMGQSAHLNVVFGIATMLIAIPTGVKVYDWMATMYRGRIRITTPVIYTAGFIILFVLGGLTGVILANPTIDYQVHNTLFLVAHFHNVLIPGVLFGMLAGYHYWFPKAFGFRLHGNWGRASAILWILGFMFTFFPLYALGLMGMPRRSASFANMDFEPLMLVAMVGVAMVLMACAALVIQLIVSIRNREKLAVPCGDPWGGRTLEWAMPCPAPDYNFAVTPEIHGRDTFTLEKRAGKAYQMPKKFESFEMPKNTPIGFGICVASGVFGFAMIFYIWWLAALSFLSIPAMVIIRSFNMDFEEEISAETAKKDTKKWIDLVKNTPPIRRYLEEGEQNKGLAEDQKIEYASAQTK